MKYKTRQQKQTTQYNTNTHLFTTTREDAGFAEKTIDSKGGCADAGETKGLEEAEEEDQEGKGCEEAKNLDVVA